MHRHPRPPHHARRPARTTCPSATTPAATSPNACASASSPSSRDLRLAAWAHMLGFRGHFSTKSRAYSITLGALRADRASTNASAP